MALSRLHRADC